MGVIDTPQQMIEYLKICEAAAIGDTERRNRYKTLREWLEELVRVKAENVRVGDEAEKLREANHALQVTLSKCGVGYKA